MSSEVVALPELLAPVRAGLIAMREILSAELSDQGPVGERVAHISRFRGKELRAALVLLAGQAVDNRDPELPQVAAVLELIHLATLVHDDVLDGADLRRNLPSVHVAWDEQTAILLGDMLYSRAFHLSTRLRSILAASLLSLAAQRICAGEMEQAALRYRFDLDQDTYESIAAAKTAELYAAACELGARYKGEPGAWSDKEERKALELKAFGRELGLAFQIMDDVLDVIGKEVEVGKRVGNDVEDGKVTL
ncbi:MAG TPA: polyprenyl synthetase family protein, partial [Planctomycetota bacterium]|nr:polyprenyl synthetase family protein [Planctomycetota bacterium]